MIIASFYPCPFDIQERHEANATIIKENKLYSCDKAKLFIIDYKKNQIPKKPIPAKTIVYGSAIFTILK